MSAEEKKITARQWKRRSIIAFSVFALFIAAVFGIRHWIVRAPLNDGISAPLRTALDFDDRVNQTYKSDAHTAKTYPIEAAVKDVRVNGDAGMSTPLDTSTFRMIVRTNRTGADSVLYISMAELRAMPKTDVVFDFKCIEGWSQVTHWGGVRLSDFAKKYHLGTKSGAAPENDKPEDLYKYMSLVTPDGEYYVGIDMPSALHPQTILCYEMNGRPLPPEQGAPLRLIIPTKYGVKHLKRIGTMGFSDARPPDYWAERGYDYDAGL